MTFTTSPYGIDLSAARNVAGFSAVGANPLSNDRNEASLVGVSFK